MQRKMESYRDDVWSRIGQNIFSKDFIRVFAEKMNLVWISANYPLEEDFIEEFQDYVA
jgi:serine protease inhibitor